MMINDKLYFDEGNTPFNVLIKYIKITYLLTKIKLRLYF